MAYIGNNLDSDIQVNKYEYTATAGQTTFACTYDRAVDVYLNGVKLDSSDFTATNGTAIVLASGANVGDIVDINAYFDVTYGSFVPSSGNSGSALLPSGTTAQRDASPSAGYLRWNTTEGSAEIYDGAAWGSVGGGAVGDAFYENAQTVTANYTLAAGRNAMTAGPITINDGVTVTISDGSTWTIV